MVKLSSKSRLLENGEGFFGNPSNFKLRYRTRLTYRQFFCWNLHQKKLLYRIFPRNSHTNDPCYPVRYEVFWVSLPNLHKWTTIMETLLGDCSRTKVGKVLWSRGLARAHPPKQKECPAQLQRNFEKCDATTHKKIPTRDSPRVNWEAQINTGKPCGLTYRYLL